YFSVFSFIAFCFFSLTIRRPPCPPLFPYTTLFRSRWRGVGQRLHEFQPERRRRHPPRDDRSRCGGLHGGLAGPAFLLDSDSRLRSEEHTSELQSRENLVCRLLLEKKKKPKYT